MQNLKKQKNNRLNSAARLVVKLQGRNGSGGVDIMSSNSARKSLEDMPMCHHIVNSIPNSTGLVNNAQLEELLHTLRQNKAAHPTEHGRAVPSRRERLRERSQTQEKAANIPRDSNHILTSGPILLPQSGFLRIEVLNGTNRESNISIRVYNLDLSPKVLLRIGGIGFGQRVYIPGSSIATIEFEPALRSRSRIEVEICAREQIYPALYLSTEPGNSIKRLLTSAGFIKTELNSNENQNQQLCPRESFFFEA